MQLVSYRVINRAITDNAYHELATAEPISVRWLRDTASSRNKQRRYCRQATITRWTNDPAATAVDLPVSQSPAGDGADPVIGLSILRSIRDRGRDSASDLVTKAIEAFLDEAPAFMHALEPGLAGGDADAARHAARLLNSTSAILGSASASLSAMKVA